MSAQDMRSRTVTVRLKGGTTYDSNRSRSDLPREHENTTPNLYIFVFRAFVASCFSRLRQGDLQANPRRARQAGGQRRRAAHVVGGVEHIFDRDKRGDLADQRPAA